MSGGRRIDDHSFWAGKGKDGVVFPEGAKHKKESEASSFGGLGDYEDTTDKIERQQNMNTSKVHGHPRKPGHRN